MTEDEDVRSKPVLNLTGDRTWKDTIVHECICGSGLFYIIACFDESEIAGYHTEGVCYDCGAWVRVPTPIDNPPLVETS